MSGTERAVLPSRWPPRVLCVEMNGSAAPDIAVSRINVLLSSHRHMAMFRGMNGWQCYPGYRQDGDECVKVVVPPHATLRGDHWQCNTSFKQDGDVCVALVAPDNGYVQGSSVKCFAGFASGEDGTCNRIVAPANATVRNDRWTCNPGYTRTEEGTCRRL